VTFDDLGLVAPLRRALRDAGYERPTPIQEQAIGPALSGRDVLGCAQTGTGKTAAFALPILQHIDAVAGEEPALRALVLTPTRELAAQIGESFAAYGKRLEVWHTVVFGGVSDKPQIAELRRGVDILVATPGRLLDLMAQGVVRLNAIEVFVLDEADRMLDMGFLPDVRRVIAKLPAKRQTLFFSATMPAAIRELGEELLDDPVSVTVDRVSSTVERTEQRVYFVDKPDKLRLLVDLLEAPEHVRTLVFTRTKHGANRLVQRLHKAHLSAAVIHGDKSQGARTRALAAFRTGELPVLVATDLAARGLDVDDVTHVVNYELPNVPETYVHRIGRTARAGANGVAVSFCDADERPYLAEIERLIGKHLERVERHPYDANQRPPPLTDLAARRDPAARKKISARPRGQRRGPRRGRRKGNGR
jgi:ATP-dependent RNA helicase RhlE